jgi:hypothetical protein
MDASPTLDAPRQGDPITADWAARVADAANAVPRTPMEPGAFSSPFGSVPRPASQTMLGPADRPMPFDVRLVWNSGDSKTHAHIFVPTFTNLGGAYVFADASYIPRKTGVSDSNGWLDLGAVSPGDKKYIALGFTAESTDVPSASSNLHAWGVEMRSNMTAPSFANGALPWLILAYINLPSGTNTNPDTYGVFQFHRGAVYVSRWWVRWRNNQPASPNFVFRDKDGNAMFAVARDGNGGYAVSGKWYFGGELIFSSGKLMFGGTEYAPTQIKDGDGNYINVLAEVTP